MQKSNKPSVVEIPIQSTINQTVKVQSLVDSHLYYTGRESGRQYEWERAGAIVDVNEDDVPELLAKRYGKKQCCGQGRTKIFQLVPL